MNGRLHKWIKILPLVIRHHRYRKKKKKSFCLCDPSMVGSTFSALLLLPLSPKAHIEESRWTNKPPSKRNNWKAEMRVIGIMSTPLILTPVLISYVTLDDNQSWARAKLEVKYFLIETKPQSYSDQHNVALV